MNRPGPLAFLSLVFALGCGAADTSAPDWEGPVSISLEPDTLDLLLGEPWLLRARVANAAGASVDRQVTWWSSDPGVASVTADGVVSGTGVGQARIRAEVADVEATVLVRVAEPLSLGVPVEGSSGVDYHMNHYVAHADAAGEVVDFRCGEKAPAEHAGTDFALADFEVMRLEVPVRAASPGIVTSVHDGEPNFSIHIDPDAPPNRVVIDHGQGRRTVYENLWAGTLRVSVGDTVVAGAELGLVGASGGSWIPHLHFEVRLHQRVVDPFSGPCAGPVEQWAEPLGYDDRFRVIRARVSDYQLQTAPHFSVDVPAARDTIVAGRYFVAWIQEFNAEVGSRSRIRLLDSAGRVRRDADQIRLVGPRGLTWFGVRLSAVDEGVGGPWTMEYLYDGRLMRRRTFEMLVR
ncbi:MAG: peptidoglycan DD-metalloendopeptidase family protein [Gemmatimonadota bacterium]